MENGIAARVGRAVCAFGLALVGGLVLAYLDSAATTASSNGGALVGFVCVWLVLALAWLGPTILDRVGARAVVLATLPFSIFALPCFVRMADGPLTDAPTTPPMSQAYSSTALLAIGALSFATALLADWAMRRPRSAAPTGRELARPDALTLAMIGLCIACLVPTALSASMHPTLNTVVASSQIRTELTVPPLDGAFGESMTIFEDDRARIEIQRTHPPPLQIGRLTVDLVDGKGPRAVPNVSVGGGERLRLETGGELTWTLSYAESPPSFVPLASWVRGAETPPSETRAVDVRGELAPAPLVVALTAVALLGVATIAWLGERRRRHALVVAAGRQATLRHDGTFEADGETFTVEERSPVWPGPVVLLGVGDTRDPYRGARAARSAIAGTLEAHVSAALEARADDRARLAAAGVLALLPAVAAAVVGYWGG